MSDRLFTKALLVILILLLVGIVWLMGYLGGVFLDPTTMHLLVFVAGIVGIVFCMWIISVSKPPVQFMVAFFLLLVLLVIMYMNGALYGLVHALPQCDILPDLSIVCK